MSRLAFLDTETVTLEPGPDVMWEIGVITRDGGRDTDREWRYQLRPNMAKANPESLEIGRFKERYELAGKRTQALTWSQLQGDEPAKLTLPGLALSTHTLLDGRSIFGICPSFDTVRISLFLRKQFARVPGYRDPFHYQPHDVEDEVAGWVAARGQEALPSGLLLADVLAVPRPTELLCRAVGINPDAYEKHTGIGDARLARDLHDAVHGGAG